MSCLAILMTAFMVITLLYKVSPNAWDWFEAGFVMAGFAAWGILLHRAFPPLERPREIPRLPVERFEFTATSKDRRTIQRTTLDLTAADLDRLRQIARDLAAGESFTARSFRDYNYWRKKFFRWNWACWANPKNNRDGIEFVRAGRSWLAYLANEESA